ncbi:MAG: TetR/AcrR family transcriptional regulator [Clostridiaceae bacterium]
MSVTRRRENDKDVLRKKIIDAASEILALEGYDKLSIRKIATKIEYSPGIIYHYFKDKAEIVVCVVEEGYGRIMRMISESPVDADHPEEMIKNTMRNYIELMLETPHHFRAILMNDIKEIQEKVNMLDEGISKRRSSISALCKVIEMGVKSGKFKSLDVELTAQIIWTLTFGLLSRLVLEKNISKEQQDRLINHHFDILFNGLMK